MNSQENKYGSSLFSILIILIVLIIIGLSLLPLLNVQLTPSRSLPGLSVDYSWPDASAKVIEQEVTSLLEGLFSGVRGVKEVSSVSKKGYGVIDISFKKNINLDAARFEIASLIREAYPKLPPQVDYPELSLNSSGQSEIPIMTYTLNASVSPFFILKYAEDHLVPKLSVIPGISSVNVYGSTPYEWEVCINSNQTESLDIHSSEITEAITNYFRNENLGQGSLQGLQQKNGIITGVYLSSTPLDTIKWRTIPIKKIKEHIVLLGDIANINYKEQLCTSYFRVNGLNTINLVIYPDSKANNFRLGKRIKQEIAILKKELPLGYSLLLVNDTTKYLNDELHKIEIRTTFSLLILLTFVLLISRQLKYLLLIIISIIANLSIACIFYYALGIEIHLYTLAGITISFGMIIDNSIIMIDHIRHQGNRKAFLAILAATLAVVGSMSMIFLLKEEQKINLIEFGQVIIVNLSVSMLIALFFIPALMEMVKIRKKHTTRLFRNKRRIIKLSCLYQRFIGFNRHYKWAYLLIFILGFGLPIQWLPTKIEHEGYWASWYNKTLGSGWFVENAKPKLEIFLGGSLRLFTEHVFENSFYSEPTRTTLYARGKMPEGCTVQQLNEAIIKMEIFLSMFREIELFQTSIISYNNSMISIQFKPEYELTSFPYTLMEEVKSKAISLGGMDWSVYGVGEGFSNVLNSGYKNNQFLLEGYNYDQLYHYAKLLKNKLEKNERVIDAEITGSNNWNANSLYEYSLALNHERFGISGENISQFYSFLQDKVFKANLSPVYLNNELQPISLVSDSYGSFNVWDLNNRPIQIGNNQFKLSGFGTITKQKTGNDIYKNNQQYQLIVDYNFIGPEPLAKLVRERHEKEFSEILPLGYSIRKLDRVGWDNKEKNQYLLIFLVILIIYFVCSILLESLRQPFAIIFMIPISFIGVFLVFYLFGFNFDQGGFASFVLLCGIVVNAGLYIINDYNNFCRTKQTKDSLKLYIKAFNHKIIPIFLTIISSVLGLVPFIWSGQKEAFWFAFAVGAIGGLIFSIIACLIYLPLMLQFKK